MAKGKWILSNRRTAYPLPIHPTIFYINALTEENLVVTNGLNIFSAFLTCQSSAHVGYHKVKFLGRELSNVIIGIKTMFFSDCQYCSVNVKYLLPNGFKYLVINSYVSSTTLSTFWRDVAANRHGCGQGERAVSFQISPSALNTSGACFLSKDWLWIAQKQYITVSVPMTLA